MEEKQKRVLSLIQPSGIPTLGNYLGALKNWSDIADEYECAFGVADLHALGGRDTGSLDHDLQNAILAVERISVQHKVFIGIGLVLALAVAAQLRGNVLRLAQRLDSGVGVGIQLDLHAVKGKDDVISGQSALGSLGRRGGILIFLFFGIVGFIRSASRKRNR